MAPVRVRALRRDDWREWQRLRWALWPDTDAALHAAEMEAILARPDCFGAFGALAEDRLIGFVEVARRDHANGCAASPVGYIEGWYVEQPHRRQGHGRALVEAAERWARERGCREMASDTGPANDAGQRAHRALGYEETERVVLFRKSLA